MGKSSQPPLKKESGGWRNGLPCKMFGTGHAGNDGNRYGKHTPSYRFVEQGCGQRKTKEGLQQLQLANGGNATLRQAAIPEYKTNQHAEQRDIGKSDEGGHVNV